MKTVSETKSIRIYPMKDNTYGIMWKIHPPESCFEKFYKENWAKNEKELMDEINKISKFIISKKKIK